ncbi:MAG: hypothetical protein ACM3WU_04655 [Bacillota bacterium]
MRHRSRPFHALLAIAVVLILSAKGFPALAASAPGISATGYAEEIAAVFPDRKTSSYDSSRFTSFVAAKLTEMGWTARVASYSKLIKSLDERVGSASFTHVAGENVLAYSREMPPGKPVDLLIVAPYDVFIRETGDPQEISYTARATGALLSFAGSREAWADESPAVALAFVSGHYQYGAGMEALLEELTVAEGRQVLAAVVLGDIDALDSLPIAVHSQTPSGLLQSVHDAAGRAGVSTTVAGPGARESWYRVVTTPRAGAFSVESMFDGGQFKGEAHVLASKGIPALSLGTPRNNVLWPLDTGSDGKPEQVAASLISLVEAGPQLLTGGPPLSETVVFQLPGSLYLIPRDKLLTASLVSALLAAGLIVFRQKQGSDLTSLALFGGVLLAMVVAHLLRTAWFSGDPERYAALLRPHASLFLYVWSGLMVVTFGVFRIWRVKVRIAYLHSKMESYKSQGTVASEQPVSAGEPSSIDESTNAGEPSSDEHPSAAEQPLVVEQPAQAAQPSSVDRPGSGGKPTPKPGAGNWSGHWALASIAAVLLGTSLLGSEIAVPALVATACLALFVLIDRPDRFPKPVTLIVRLLGAAAALLPAVWAGSPLVRDAARVYAISAARIGVEAVAFTVSLAAFIACVVSAFRLPEPVPGRSMLMVTLAEILILAVFVAVGIMIPRKSAQTLPARALLEESVGSDSRVNLYVTRPVGTIQLLATGEEAAVPGLPASIVNRGFSELMRLPATPAADWAEIVHHQSPPEKGDKEHRSTGEVLATFRERPAYYRLTFQDVPLTRSSPTPFRLENAGEVIGLEAPPAAVEVTGSRPGYSITVTWWMPVHLTLAKNYSVLVVPSSSRVEVVGRAVYLDRSYIGLTPSAPSTQFVQVTAVSGARGYN